MMNMENLTERQKFILTLVIHEYIRTATPVGSQNLVNLYRLEYSPATVRNEMAALTELGYLRQPHTSAGRVPSEEGYRYFVSRLLHETELPDPTRRMISHQFYQSRHDVDEWMRLAASILAYQSKGASLVTAPHAEMARLKHLELISTRGRQVLMVLVMHTGEVRQRILATDEPVSQETLSAAASRATEFFQGKSADGIQSMREQLQDVDRDVCDWVVTEMSQSENFLSDEVYLDGLTNMLAEPEFSGTEDARRALRLLEERPALQDLLNRTVLTGSVGGIQVLIGGEGTWDELRQCSIILARYGSPGVATGTLGVLGPMRMHYGRSISTVRFVASLLTDMVSETISS
jgi:heat-inducible transcriptional repressor